MASKKRSRHDEDDDDNDEDDSSAYSIDACGSYDTLSSPCCADPGTYDDSATQWHRLNDVDDDEYEQAVEPGLAERRGRSWTRKPLKRACLWREAQEVKNDPSEQAGDDRRDRPLLTASLSTVSAVDAVTGPNKLTATPEYQNPLTTSSKFLHRPGTIEEVW